MSILTQTYNVFLHDDIDCMHDTYVTQQPKVSVWSNRQEWIGLKKILERLARCYIDSCKRSPYTYSHYFWLKFLSTCISTIIALVLISRSCSMIQRLLWQCQYYKIHNISIHQVIILLCSLVLPSSSHKISVW